MRKEEKRGGGGEREDLQEFPFLRAETITAKSRKYHDRVGDDYGTSTAAVSAFGLSRAFAQISSRLENATGDVAPSTETVTQGWWKDSVILGIFGTVKTLQYRLGRVTALSLDTVNFC